MDFKQAVMSALTRYVDFSGRATRPEFWWFFLFQMIVFAVTGMIHPVLNGVAALALLLPGLGVGVRRLHDIGQTHGPEPLLRLAPGLERAGHSDRLRTGEIFIVDRIEHIMCRARL